MNTKSNVGKIGWLDISVKDASGLRDFYSKVVGWKAEPVDMGGYDDYMMGMPGSGEPAAGVCHARGSNTDMPRQWLIYIFVDLTDAGNDACRGNGIVVKAVGGQSPDLKKRCTTINQFPHPISR